MTVFPEKANAACRAHGKMSSKVELLRICQCLDPIPPEQPWAFYVEKKLPKVLKHLVGNSWVVVNFLEWVGAKTGSSHPYWCHWRLHWNCEIYTSTHEFRGGDAIPVVTAIATLTDYPRLGEVGHQSCFAYPSTSHKTPPYGWSDPDKVPELQAMAAKIAKAIGSTLGLPTVPPAHVRRLTARLHMAVSDSDMPAIVPEELAL